MNISFGSIRARLIIWLLSVTGIVLTAVILWSYAAARQRLERGMESKAMFTADGAASRIDARLGVLQGVVHGMALHMETQYPAFTLGQAKAMLEQCLREHDDIYGACAAIEPGMAPPGWTDLAAYEHREGTGFLYTDLSGAEHRRIHEDWFSLPKQLDRPVWSEPYRWQETLMVTYSVPLFSGRGDARCFFGVITCDLTIDWLDQVIAELPLGRDSYGLLMSKLGTYISHPLSELVLNETVFSVAEERGNQELREVGQSMVSGRPDIISFTSFVSGNPSWLAYTQLRSTDWIMAALISKTEMNSEITLMSRKQAGMGLIGLILLYLGIALIARSITRPIHELSDAANTLAAGDLDAPLPRPRGRDEAAHLTRAFSDMRDSLKRYIADLNETTAARERMSSELRIARDIQMSLVPKTFPPFPDRTDIDLFAMIEPAREIGGDFYDFFMLDQDRLVLAIGDVSGKGVPAALFMAATRSFLRSAFRFDSDPASALERVNNELVDGNETNMFVTLFCAVIDIRQGVARYANAGHNAPLIRHQGGRVEWLAEPHGTVAGPLPNAFYETGRLSLSPEAILVLYTDGVNEAMNQAGELFGDERLAAVAARAKDRIDCESLLGSIIEDVRGFAAGAEQSDDITMLAFKLTAIDARA